MESDWNTHERRWMFPRRHGRRRWRRLVTCVAMVACWSPIALRADWLVLGDGSRLQTQGSWSVRGRVVVFHDAHGTLSSLRLDEVDLEASTAATREAATPATALPVAAPPAVPVSPPPPPVLVLTDRDIPAGVPSAVGIDRLIAELRQAHRQGSVEAAMALVDWIDAAPGVEAVMRETFATMIAHPLVAIDLVAAAAEDTAPLVDGGVTYVPNLPVTGKLEVELGRIDSDPVDEPDPSVTFLVGQRLGSYGIVAAMVSPSS